MTQSGGQLIPYDYAQLPGEVGDSLKRRARKIKGIAIQSAIEIGEELAAAQEELRNKDDGFQAWVEGEVGMPNQRAYDYIAIYEASKKYPPGGYFLENLPFSTQVTLIKAPDPQEAINEAMQRAEDLEQEVTRKLAREVAARQRAERIVQDETKSAQVRLGALQDVVSIRNTEINSLKQEVTRLRQQKTPQVIEKSVEKRVEVMPPDVENKITKMQEKITYIEKERDRYQEQLGKERTIARERMIQNVEGENTDRMRKEVAAALRDCLSALRTASNLLPSATDALTFDATDWQRVREVEERLTKFAGELRTLRNSASMVTDATAEPSTNNHYVVESSPYHR